MDIRLLDGAKEDLRNSWGFHECQGIPAALEDRVDVDRHI